MKKNYGNWLLFFFVSGLMISLGTARADTNIETDSASAVTPVTIDQLLAGYRPIQSALVNDDLAKAQKASESLRALASRWLSENSGAQAVDVKNIGTGSEKLAAAQDLDEARIAFIEINRGVIAVIRADENLKTQWQLFFCPMVAGRQGYWVEPKGEPLANPFMGQAMPGCGSKKPW